MPPPTSSPPREDFDSPWKEALEHFLPHALALFAPDLHAHVDWGTPPVFLDKEFQDLAAGVGVRGRRQVDKLARLALASGRYVWLLLHIEVESRRSTPAALRCAALRVQQYGFLVHDRYVLRPALADAAAPLAAAYTLVVFTRGEGPAWLEADYQPMQNRPLRYRAVYLESWLARWQALREAAPGNPIAVVIMAQLLAHRHRRAERLAPKVGLVRLLLGGGYRRADVAILLRLIDWILTLPAELEGRYVRIMHDIGKESTMAFVTSYERVYTKRGIEIGEEVGLKRGEHLGLSRMLAEQAEQKFGLLPDWARQRLQQADTEQLRAWGRRLLGADSLQAVFSESDGPG
ncbi:hypothetical protein CAL15_11770 [Bordetella genomosp. 13]|uniref:Cytosolic protein n=1 Tax=Bordetella genomosp. 13 TaxID=463040 RepID=A0A1W6ZC73_9BORD|nr:hypothetical protein CAL15_11770 [Bordetella genomosp. 13]